LPASNIDPFTKTFDVPLVNTPVFIQLPSAVILFVSAVNIALFCMNPKMLTFLLLVSTAPPLITKLLSTDRSFVINVLVPAVFSTLYNLLPIPVPPIFKLPLPMNSTVPALLSKYPPLIRSPAKDTLKLLVPFTSNVPALLVNAPSTDNAFVINCNVPAPLCVRLYIGLTVPPVFNVCVPAPLLNCTVPSLCKNVALLFQLFPTVIVTPFALSVPVLLMTSFSTDVFEVN